MSPLVLDGPYAKKDFYNFITTSNLPRHRWYYFKEGFSVELIKEAISQQKKQRKLNILDPFSGSGTTVLTSTSLGHNSVGIEVNPFLKFVANVKTSLSDLSESELLLKLNSIIYDSKGGSYSPLEGFSTFTPKEGLSKWLFNTSVIRSYTSTLHAITKNISTETESNLFRFAALVAAIECSNAKKDGKGLRYKKDWQQKGYDSSHYRQRFAQIARIVIDDLSDTTLDRNNKPKIIGGDSRLAIENLNRDCEFDLLITSPPYLNSFDYTDIYRAELFLGGFVKNNQELNALRHHTLRSHVQIDWQKDVEYDSSLLQHYFQKVTANKDKLWHSRIPLMIRAYFDDLYKILKSAQTRLTKGGEIWLVVSTSAYAGVHIPVDILLGNIGHELDFQLKGVHCLRNLRTSSQQYKQLNIRSAPLRESLVILKKN